MWMIFWGYLMNVILYFYFLCDPFLYCWGFLYNVNLIINNYNLIKFSRNFGLFSLSLLFFRKSMIKDKWETLFQKLTER